MPVDVRFERDVPRRGWFSKCYVLFYDVVTKRRWLRQRTIHSFVHSVLTNVFLLSVPDRISAGNPGPTCSASPDFWRNVGPESYFQSSHISRFITFSRHSVSGSHWRWQCWWVQHMKPAHGDDFWEQYIIVKTYLLTYLIPPLVGMSKCLGLRRSDVLVLWSVFVSVVISF